jgi:phosphatidylinositol-3-phosphatase
LFRSDNSTRRRRRRASAIVGPLLALSVAACASSATAAPTTRPTPAPASPTVAATSSLPDFAHIYVLVLENEEFGSIAGSAEAPYLNSLIAANALAANYFGVAHPSQPNYLAMFSGSTQGVTDDGVHDLTGTNLADQLEAKGKIWAVVEQDYPGACFTGASKGGKGEGGGQPGSYARKHNPAISFTSIGSNPAHCGRITNLSAFDPAAADFQLIVPNQCNDMHNCPVATGDAFLRDFVPRITGSPDFARSVLFITLDEGDTDVGGGGHVATIVVSPLTKPGFTSSVRYDHYSLLRTIEDAWGLGCLANACSAAPMSDFFAR